jgi:RNA-directed DNA polymerase
MRVLLGGRESRLQGEGRIRMETSKEMIKSSHTAVTAPVTPSGNGADGNQGLERLAARARSRPQEKFNSLAHHISPGLIERKIKETAKRSASGIDGLTRDQTLANLDWLLPPKIAQIHRKEYDASAVRRVYIPKTDGKLRALGIPPILERGIQAATSAVLEQIYEQDFLSCSFGYRPNRGCHNALATLNHFVRNEGLKFAYEVDIRDFFGSLDHGWLLRFLGHRISDERVLKLIEAWLKAGVMEEGRYLPTEVGSPQGGSISPLLANVYLHYALDLWFDRKVKPQLGGRAELIRYCDDFVILFQKEEDIDDVAALLKARLAQFGLEVAENKTHRTDLRQRPSGGANDRRRISFLGFEIFEAKTQSGKGTKMVFKTQGSRFSRSMQKLKDKLHDMMHWQIEDQAERLNLMLRGHYNYYGLPGNSRRLTSFHNLAVRYWRRSLSQRSQRGNLIWPEFRKILERHPITPPKLHITYGTLSKHVKL